MRILSIDIGSRNFGYSILSKQKEDDLYTLIKPAYIYLAADRIGDRLLLLTRRLEKEIEDYLVDIIVFEDSKFKGKSAPDLHYVCGILHLLGAQYQIPVKRISPSAVKRLLTNNGKATKKDVELAASNYLSNPPMEFENDHVSDSVGIGIAHFLR